MNEKNNNNVIYLVCICIALLIIGTIMIGWPVYNVWASEQHGKAELARAEYNRQIAVVEAQQKNDSAKFLAGAEITRAYGVAKANKIIGDSLQGNQAYLDYLWLTEKVASDADKEVIYVPTENQLPILASGVSTTRKAAT
jgi:hypothetical protein